MTGVQTCALPISKIIADSNPRQRAILKRPVPGNSDSLNAMATMVGAAVASTNTAVYASFPTTYSLPGGTIMSV